MNKNTKAEMRINAYICDDLHVTITKDVDKGTTPMFITCPACGERASSRMYAVNQSLTPEWEWYKPTDADVEKEVDELLAKDKDDHLPAKKILINNYNDHVKQGGLLMRKIEKAKEAPIEGISWEKDLSEYYKSLDDVIIHEKYNWKRLDADVLHVWHIEDGRKTLIATTDTAEKAHFIAKACNQFDFELFEKKQKENEDIELHKQMMKGNLDKGQASPL